MKVESPVFAIMDEACDTSIISFFLSFHQFWLSIVFIVVLEILVSFSLEFENSLCAPVFLWVSAVHVLRSSVCMA